MRLHPDLLGQRSYAYIRFARRLLAELDGTVYQCEQRVILTDTHVLTRVVNGASLANDDVARLCELTTEKLHTESLALRLTAGLRTTDTIFLGQGSLILIMRQYPLRESGSGTDGDRCTSDNQFCASS